MTNTPLAVPQGLLRRLRDRFGRTQDGLRGDIPATATLDIDLDALGRERQDDDGWLTRPAVQVRGSRSQG